MRLVDNISAVVKVSENRFNKLNKFKSVVKSYNRLLWIQWRTKNFFSLSFESSWEIETGKENTCVIQSSIGIHICPISFDLSALTNFHCVHNIQNHLILFAWQRILLWSFLSIIGGSRVTGKNIYRPKKSAECFFIELNYNRHHQNFPSYFVVVALIH